MIERQSWGEVVGFRMARSFLGRGFYFTAAYWVDGLLVDTGCARTARELQRALGTHLVHWIVNTHHHEDHIGGNGAVQRAFSATILAPEGALPYLAEPRKLRLQLYRRLFWGWPEPSEGVAIGEEVRTEHHRFRVIPTPGHTPEHIALFEPEAGWLFAGDAFIGGQDKGLLAGSDIYAVIQSLRTLLALEPRWLFPGSGRPRENPSAEIAQKVCYLEGLGERVRGLHQQGLSFGAIRRRVLGRELPIAYLTLGHFSAQNLVRSYLRPEPAEGGFDQGQPSHRGER